MLSTVVMLSLPEEYLGLSIVANNGMFVFMCYVPVNIFRSCQDVFLSFCVEPVLSRGYSALLKDTAQFLR